MRRWIAWNLFFRLQESLKRHATFSILKEMERADRLSREALEQLQAVKLQDLVSYCYAHVPYVRNEMRDAGVTPAEIRGPRDLVRLPLMRKADVRQNRALLRSDRAGKLSSMSTGGSTGEPLIFDISRQRTASRVACRQRVSRWWGVSVGDPELALWGSPVELTRQDWLRAIRDQFLATRLLSAFEMNEKTMSGYLDIMEAGNFRQVFGYPSAVYLLCVHVRKQRRNVRPLGIQVAFVTGEVLFPYQRDLINETLNCPVADGYGGRDSGFIAHECPQGGMHLMADAMIVEIVDGDGRPVPPREVGEIVVTDLYSHEAPFLRYATGDRGALSDQPCSCGRALPLLGRIEGRSNDSIVTPDGRNINSLAVIYVVREVEGIEQFRVIQKDVDRLHAQIVRNGQYPAAAEERIRDGWARLFRAPIHVTFEYLADIPLERAGKFRHIVSEVPALRSHPRTEDDHAKAVQSHAG